MSSGKVLSFLIQAKDMTRGVLRSVGSRFKSFASGIFRNFTNIYFMGRTVVGSVKAIGSALLSGAMGLQSGMAPFQRFFKSIPALKAHLEGIRKIAASGVFEFGELKDTSLYLLKISDGLLGLTNDLKVLGDVATTNGEELRSVAEKAAEFYQKLKYGEDLKEPIMQMERLGMISKRAGLEIVAMSKSGASSAAIWRRLKQEFSRFSGGIEADAKHAESAVGRLKEAWRRDLEEAGKLFLDFAVKHLDALTKWLTEIREDGSLGIWMSKAVAALTRVSSTIQTVLDKLGRLKDNASIIGGAYLGAKAGGPVGAMIGGTVGLAYDTTKETIRAGKAAEKTDARRGVPKGVAGSHIRKIDAAAQGRTTSLDEGGELALFRKNFTTKDEARAKPGKLSETMFGRAVMSIVRKGQTAMGGAMDALHAEDELKKQDAARAAEKARRAKIDEEIKKQGKTLESIDDSFDDYLDKNLERRSALVTGAQTLKSKAAEDREAAISPQARKAREKRAKEEAAAEDKYQGLLKSAKYKMDISSRRHGAFGTPLSESESLALKAEEEKKLATKMEKEAKELDKAAKEAAKRTAKATEAIQEKIETLLVMKESA